MNKYKSMFNLSTARILPIHGLTSNVVSWMEPDILDCQGSVYRKRLAINLLNLHFSILPKMSRSTHLMLLEKCRIKFGHPVDTDGNS